MYRNFIRLASANINTKLLNVEHNVKEIKNCIDFSKEKNVDILLLPELSLTGVSAGQMIGSKEIFNRSKKALKQLLEFTKGSKTLVFVGMPIRSNNQTYSTMVALQDGEIIDILAKPKLSPKEKVYLSDNITDAYLYLDEVYHFFSNLGQYKIEEKDFNFQVVFDNDFDNINESSNLVLVPGYQASDYKSLTNLRNNLKTLSSVKEIGLIFAGPTASESSSDSVFSGEKYIIEAGKVLEEGKKFEGGLIYTDINMDQITSSKNVYEPQFNAISINLDEKEISLKRELDQFPYFPNKEEWNQGMQNILDIQVQALARRLRQVPGNKLYLGLSGGLDSTLSIIASKLAFELLGRDLKDIHAITMPGLGTSSRTKNNALELGKAYGVSIDEISIKESVIQHFKDIDHDINDTSVAYENAQARERTQILMDLANKHNGIVLGTGNMSEIGLGWATYNGDHMSMYGVNSGLPKTLLREVVRYVKDISEDEIVKATLADIIDTPISPELLPSNEDGSIAQKTEDNVGPYELHDFFMYHLIRNDSKISDIYFMACKAFEDKYSSDIVEKWLTHFLRRFVSQQFKRNVAVDGPQILDYSLSPKFGFVMPSDIDIEALIQNIKE